MSPQALGMMCMRARLGERGGDTASLRLWMDLNPTVLPFFLCSKTFSTSQGSQLHLIGSDCFENGVNRASDHVLVQEKRMK